MFVSILRYFPQLWRRYFGRIRSTAHCRCHWLRSSIACPLCVCKLCHDAAVWKPNNENMVGQTPRFRSLAVYKYVINLKEIRFPFIEQLTDCMTEFYLLDVTPSSPLKINRQFGCLLLASWRFLAWLIIYPENGGYIFLRNVCWHITE